MDRPDFFQLIGGVNIERVQYIGTWRISWPHEGKTISRDISADRDYIESLAKALSE